MTDLAPIVPVGNDILDIGSRKARRQRNADPMAPSAAMLMGAPAQFDVPNVSNVRFLFMDKQSPWPCMHLIRSDLTLALVVCVWHPKHALAHCCVSLQIACVSGCVSAPIRRPVLRHHISFAEHRSPPITAATTSPRCAERATKTRMSSS